MAFDISSMVAPSVKEYIVKNQLWTPAGNIVRLTSMIDQQPENDKLYVERGKYHYRHNEWGKAIKASGAKYITLTSRHHDGFSLWPTKVDDGYNIANTPFKRDILGELSDVLDCSPLDIIGTQRKPTRSLFVALIYENEELFYKKSKEILQSDYLCEVAVKNTILFVFEHVEKVDGAGFVSFFTDVLEKECKKLLNEKGSEHFE